MIKKIHYHHLIFTFTKIEFDSEGGMLLYDEKKLIGYVNVCSGYKLKYKWKIHNTYYFNLTINDEY